MAFHLGDVLKAVGGSAAIIFAAWIFLSFLQTRYDAAVDRYRELIDTHRKREHGQERGEAIKREVEVYARRCTLMSRAVTTGLCSAVLFLITLIGGALDVIIPKNPVITLVSTAASILGFALVIVAAALVMVDNFGATRQLRQELRDIDDISTRSTTRATRLAS